MRKTLLIASATVVMSLLTATPALATSNTKNDDHKVGICHTTGSETNHNNVDKHALKAHENHEDERDNAGDKSDKDCQKPVDCPKKAAPTSPKPSTSPSPSPSKSPSTSPNPGKGGAVLGSNTEPQPTRLPETGAGLSALLGIPSLAVAGRAYLRSRANR